MIIYDKDIEDHPELFDPPDCCFFCNKPLHSPYFVLTGFGGRPTAVFEEEFSYKGSIVQGDHELTDELFIWLHWKCAEELPFAINSQLKNKIRPVIWKIKENGNNYLL